MPSTASVCRPWGPRVVVSGLCPLQRMQSQARLLFLSEESACLTGIPPELGRRSPRIRRQCMIENAKSTFWGQRGGNIESEGPRITLIPYENPTKLSSRAIQRVRYKKWITPRGILNLLYVKWLSPDDRGDLPPGATKRPAPDNEPICPLSSSLIGQPRLTFLGS